jgi:hypothetical protein
MTGKSQTHTHPYPLKHHRFAWGHDLTWLKRYSPGITLMLNLW